MRVHGDAITFSDAELLAFVRCKRIQQPFTHLDISIGKGGSVYFYIWSDEDSERWMFNESTGEFESYVEEATANMGKESVTINGMTVSVEFVDTPKEFKWRLTCGQENSPWSKHYSGLLVHKFINGRTFAVATDYWSGVLPVQTPFEILTKEVVIRPNSG